MVECFCRKTSNGTNFSQGTASSGSSSIFATGMLVIRCLGTWLPYRLLDGFGDSKVYMDGGGIVEEVDVWMCGKDEVVGEVGNCKDETVGTEDHGDGEVVGTEDSGEGEVVDICKDEVMGRVDRGSVCI